MPKAIVVPPALNTADIPEKGAKVTIKEVRLARDLHTQIGVTKLALGMNVEYKGEVYSQLFSMDKAILTGSIGRLLVSVGIDDTDVPDFDKKLEALVGKEIKVQKRSGKVYWYP